MSPPEILLISCQRDANAVLEFDTQLFSQYNHTTKSEYLPNVIGVVVLNEKGREQCIKCLGPKKIRFCLPDMLGVRTSTTTCRRNRRFTWSSATIPAPAVVDSSSRSAACSNLPVPEAESEVSSSSNLEATAVRAATCHHWHASPSPPLGGRNTGSSLQTHPISLVPRTKHWHRQHLTSAKRAALTTRRAPRKKWAANSLHGATSASKTSRSSSMMHDADAGQPLGTQYRLNAMPHSVIAFRSSRPSPWLGCFATPPAASGGIPQTLS